MLQTSPAYRTGTAPRAIRRWLYIVAGLIVAMVIVGGITRLTESGLSITRWQPIRGTLPPLGEAAWQAEFDRYKQIPEYAAFNQGMTLSGFKAIFFWEYLHRLLGRVIGLAFALPLAWFAIRRQIPHGFGRRLLALLALGGLQGTIGWWMVASGLVDRTDVSHIRLAVHLLTALFILAGIIWTARDLELVERWPTARGARLTPVAIVALGLLTLQLLFGALTAGLDAGYAFSSWPLMGDAWFPADTPMTAPLLSNLIDNPVVVQFIHRWLAFVAGGGLLWLGHRAAKAGARRPALWVAVLLIAQIALGIATLLTGVRIEVAVAHQANAALLLIASVAAAHAVGSRMSPTMARTDHRFAATVS